MSICIKANKDQFFSFCELSEYDKDTVINIYLNNDTDIHNFRILEIKEICKNYNVKPALLFEAEDESVLGFILKYCDKDTAESIKKDIQKSIDSRALFS